MKRLATLAIAVTALLLTGCSSNPAALDECIAEVANHFDVDATDVEVTETVKSPVGAYDWKGVAGDGTFACASPDGTKLTSALAFDATGMPETLVVR